MMTGIPIENNIWSAYLLTAFLVIVGFAFYDIFHRRVPDLALVFFIPLAAAAPLIKSWFALDCGQPPLWLSAWIQYSSGCCHSDWRDRHGRR